MTDFQEIQQKTVKTSLPIKPKYKILSELPLEKNIILIDAYGVFYDGSKLIADVVEQMKELKNQNRTVVVVSNTTQLSSEAINSYEKRGLKQGEDYDHFITSGDVFRQTLKDGTLASGINFTENRKIKIYVHGKPNTALFAEIDNFEITDDLEESDAVYMSIPQYTFKEIQKIYPNAQLDEGNLTGLPEEVIAMFKKSNLTKPNEPDRWDSISIDVFLPFLNKCEELDKPLLNANPDTKAPEKERGTENINQVIRNGTLTKEYRKRNKKVFECGKPNTLIYEYTMKKLELTEEDKSRCIMIGDTEKTDIAGAVNFEIDSALTLCTGNAGRKLKKHQGTSTHEQKLKKSRATYFVENVQ